MKQGSKGPIYASVGTVRPQAGHNGSRYDGLFPERRVAFLSGDRAFPSRRPRVSGDTFMRLRLDEHDWPQWLTRIATHPVTAVAALVAVVLVALWALIALEARHVNGPRTPLIFSPK